MSHVVACETRIKDLHCAALAVQRLGGTLDLDKKEHKWYGRWVNDYHANDAAYQRGIKPEDYGKCDACISFPGVNYEAGLVKMPEGDYALVFDFIDRKLTAALGGQKAEGFMQAYAAEKCKLEARRKGYTVSETKDAAGNIIMKLTGG